jgi:hypothetical protein
MILKGGHTNYEQLVGVLMLDTRFPRMRGDIGNARSFDFPVRYKTVKGAHATKIMGEKPSPELLAPFIEAARALEAEGVRCITTSCGFLGPFQKDIAAVVKIPVLTSALMQAPLIHAMLPPGQIIGVFTERAQHMNKGHFESVGWSPNQIPVQVQGMPDDAAFPATFIIGREQLDTDELRAEMLAMTREFMRTCPNPGAILFECTNFCPYSADVAAESGLPVFDINTLINTFHSAIRPPRYL